MGEKSYRLAVASDLHYLAPELMDEGRAFRELTELADGRVTRYSEAVLRAFVREMQLLRPDAVLITGDLTLNGESLSHKHLAAAFDILQKTGIPLLVFPGNHDVDNIMAGAYLGEEAAAALALPGKEFCRLYDRFHGGGIRREAKGRVLSYDPSSMGYAYALGERVWILCIDINGCKNPGMLSEETCAWAEGVLRRAKEEGSLVVGASHQNLLAHNELVAAGYVMLGNERLLELYGRYGVRLHLSGHMHVQHWKCVGRVTEIASSSLGMPPCQYGILDIGTGGFSYQTRALDVEGWAEEEGIKDWNLLHFSSYAKDYYYQWAKRGMLRDFSGLEIPGEKKGQLADGLARFFQAYFSGTLDRLSDREEIREKLREEAPENFWNLWMDSVMAEGIKDENRAARRFAE